MLIRIEIWYVGLIGLSESQNIFENLLQQLFYGNEIFRYFRSQMLGEISKKYQQNIKKTKRPFFEGEVGR